MYKENPILQRYRLNRSIWTSVTVRSNFYVLPLCALVAARWGKTAAILIDRIDPKYWSGRLDPSLHGWHSKWGENSVSLAVLRLFPVRWAIIHVLSLCALDPSICVSGIDHVGSCQMRQNGCHPHRPASTLSIDPGGLLVFRSSLR